MWLIATILGYDPDVEYRTKVSEISWEDDLIYHLLPKYKEASCCFLTHDVSWLDQLHVIHESIESVHKLVDWIVPLPIPAQDWKKKH